jgi:hypothetical protein
MCRILARPRKNEEDCMGFFYFGGGMLNGQLLFIIFFSVFT